MSTRRSIPIAVVVTAFALFFFGLGNYLGARQGAETDARFAALRAELEQIRNRAPLVPTGTSGSYGDPSRAALIESGARLPDLLVDQGTADAFLAEQLKTDLFAETCVRADQKATIRMQPGYDHSYYFISTFMAEHVRWHAERLKR